MLFRGSNTIGFVLFPDPVGHFCVAGGAALQAVSEYQQKIYIFLDKHYFYTKIFWTYIFFDRTLFFQHNFILDAKHFWIQNILGPKKLLTKNIFKQLFFWTKNIFLHLNFFGTQISLLAKTLLDPNIFLIPFFWFKSNYSKKY